MYRCSRGRDGALRCENITDYALPVSPGDVLSVVTETSRGLYAKHKGVSGWYFGHTAPQSARESPSFFPSPP